MVLTFRTHVRIAGSLLQGMAVQAVLMLNVALVPLAAHAGTTASAQECEGFVARSKELLSNAPDSALALALRAEQCMGLLPSAERQATVLIALGDAYLATGEKPAALGVYQRAQLVIEDALEKEGSRPALVLAHSDIRMKIGALHFYLRDWEKSIADYNEAMRILDEAPEGIADDELARRKVRLFNNMAGVHIQLQDHGTALPYFEQALVLNRPLKDARNESSLNNNIGICHMEMGRYDLADQYFLKALAVRKEVGDVRGQAQVLNNLGKNQAKVGHFAAARGHYQQALSLGRAAGSRESVVITLESLAMVLDTLGEHKAALLTYRAFKALNDSLYSTETRTTIARLEEEFRRDKEKKVLELEAERKDAEAARQRTWNVALIGALFFLLLTAFLLFKVMRARVRNGLLEQEKLRLEHEKLEAEQVALRENLESRERELTANALFLLKKNELIAHIAERLLKAKSTFKQENQPIIQEIVRDLQASEDDHNWKEFEVHFTRVHSTFYQTLQERFPSLTPNERKLCAFLRLNMSTKDISAITQQSLNSITVARSRLRKKLQIEGEEVNLVDFLQAI